MLVELDLKDVVEALYRNVDRLNDSYGNGYIDKEENRLPISQGIKTLEKIITLSNQILTDLKNQEQTHE